MRERWGVAQAPTLGALRKGRWLAAPPLSLRIAGAPGVRRNSRMVPVRWLGGVAPGYQVGRCAAARTATERARGACGVGGGARLRRVQGRRARSGDLSRLPRMQERNQAAPGPQAPAAVFSGVGVGRLGVPPRGLMIRARACSQRRARALGPTHWLLVCVNRIADAPDAPPRSGRRTSSAAPWCGTFGADPGSMGWCTAHGRSCAPLIPVVSLHQSGPACAHPPAAPGETPQVAAPASPYATARHPNGYALSRRRRACRLAPSSASQSVRMQRCRAGVGVAITSCNGGWVGCHAPSH